MPKARSTRAVIWSVSTSATRLKQELAGEIVVYASRQLAHTLMEHDLVDELRLIVFPTVLGAGDRLFGETREAKATRLVGTRSVGDGLPQLTYDLVR
jgi:dihydrofolate reductase